MPSILNPASWTEYLGHTLDPHPTSSILNGTSWPQHPRGSILTQPWVLGPGALAMWPVLCCPLLVTHCSVGTRAPFTPISGDTEAPACLLSQTSNGSLVFFFFFTVTVCLLEHCRKECLSLLERKHIFSQISRLCPHTSECPFLRGLTKASLQGLQPEGPSRMCGPSIPALSGLQDGG